MRKDIDFLDSSDTIEEFLFHSSEMLNSSLTLEIKNSTSDNFRLLTTFFVKSLCVQNFRFDVDNDICKKITFLEKYHYSDEEYPHEILWYDISANSIMSSWRDFFLSKTSQQKI